MAAHADRAQDFHVGHFASIDAGRPHSDRSPRCVQGVVDRALTQAGLSALVALDPENLHDLSSVWLPIACGYLDRQNLAVWRPGGQLNTDSRGPPGGADKSALSKRRSAHLTKPAMPFAVMVDALCEFGLEGIRVSMEGLRTAVRFMEWLKGLAPTIEFVPADV